MAHLSIATLTFTAELILRFTIGINVQFSRYYLWVSLQQHPVDFLLKLLLGFWEFLAIFYARERISKVNLPPLFAIFYHTSAEKDKVLLLPFYVPYLGFNSMRI